MRISLGPQIRKMLGLSKEKPEKGLKIPDTSGIEDIKVCIERALAATCLSDMEYPSKLQCRNAKEKRYEIQMHFEWKWPVPVILELRVIDEKIWEIELVKNERAKI